MTYINAVKYINSHSGTPSPERMRLLCRYLGDPQRPQKFVQIVGGRGKTSSASILSVILNEAGFTVGCYTTSHVFELRERIRIGTAPLSHNDFAEYVRRVSVACAKMKSDIEIAHAEEKSQDGILPESAIQHKITKNLLEGKISPDPAPEEIICAAAMLAFYDKGCGISILECGDSRADPTGVIDPPLVSFICGGSIDQEQLRTACGTIRRGTREVVCSAVGREAYNTISNACAKTGSRMTVPAHGELSVKESGLRGKTFDYRGKTYSVPFCAEYHISNALAAIETVYALRRTGIPLHSADVARGIAKARIPLRFELMSISPTIIIDCAETAADIAVFTESAKKIRERIGNNVKIILPPDFAVELCSPMTSALGFQKVEFIKPDISKNLFKPLTSLASTLTENDAIFVFGAPEFAGSIKKDLERAMAYR